MSNNIVQFNEEIIKGQIKELVVSRVMRKIVYGSGRNLLQGAA